MICKIGWGNKRERERERETEREFWGVFQLAACSSQFAASDFQNWNMVEKVVHRLTYNCFDIISSTNSCNNKSDV
jgi:hypothetical protein